MPQNIHQSDSAPVSTVAQAILTALSDVLREAETRGISLTTSFHHFDRQQIGIVSVEELMVAVVELRIHPSTSSSLWDERDAEDCIAAISDGRSRTHFTRQDFVCYFAHKTDNQIPTNQKSKSSVKKLRNEKVTFKHQQLPGSAELSPPTSPDHEQRRFNSLNNVSQQSIEPQRSRKAKMPKSKKRPLVSLPNWAHERSKRALQELENMQRKRFHSPTTDIILTSIPPFDCVNMNQLEQSSSPIDGDEEVDIPSIPAHGLPRLELQASLAKDKAHYEFPIDQKRWQTFQVDDDTTISYGILTHDTTFSENHGSVEPQIHHNNSQQVDQGESLNVNLTTFRFTVFLDTFQCLETIAAFFQPLLMHFPRGKILICGFPVRISKRCVCNNEFVAFAYGQLLVHLMTTTRDWLAQPKLGVGAVPQFLIGFGTGGNVALQLLAMEIPLRMDKQPALRLFSQSLRGAVLVNTLITCNDAVHTGSRNLKRLLLSKNHVELNESLIAGLFSDYYLTQVAPSRQAAMEAFFSSRPNFLHNANRDLLRVLLHGILKNKDISDTLGNLSTLPSPFALAVVHGTQNSLFQPAQVEKITKAFPEANMVPTLMDCLACHSERSTPQIHVSWLKSGHEILQERARFFYDLFRQLILVEITTATATTIPAAESISENVTVNPIPSQRFQSSIVVVNQQAVAPDRTETVCDHLDRPNTHNGEHAVMFNANGQSVTDFKQQVMDLLQTKGFKWIQQELYDRNLEGEGPTDIVLQRFQEVLIDEEMKEREHRHQIAVQQAKYDELEAKRRERQREELEHQVREKESLLNIKRKETEAQRAFFAEMEAQKDIKARLLQEQELMAYEDVLSRKVEDQLFLEEERQYRNTSMSKQVEEIAAERLEKKREEYQVQLQQQRIAAQHAKREALKQFQKEFEENELVSSAVEAYFLDSPTSFEHFTDLANGANALAKDLVHFYELKSTQKEESVGKRRELDEFKELLATKELALRNLERVLIKAKNSGMIAKAGLGTVRIVQITPPELHALTQEFDESQDALAQLQHELTLKTQDLAWKDQLLQRLSVLIKRNEGFREEMLKKLTVCADMGNELVLSNREEGEKLFEQCEDTNKLKKKIVLRLESIQHEKAKAEASSTEYFDTKLRVEGATQRVLRVVFIRELDSEIKELEAKRDTLDDKSNLLKKGIAQNKAKLHELGTRTYAIEQSLTALQNALVVKSEHFSSSNRNLNAKLATKNEKTDPADMVRRKKHTERSTEEKKWVTLDFQLNFAHYYKYIDPTEVEIIQRHPDYQNRSLKNDQIERIITLPARNCLALAFIKSKAELEAHYLIRKYTFGDGEEHFAQQDRDFKLPELAQPCVVSKSLADLASALDQAASSASSARMNFSKGHTAVLDEEVAPINLLSISQGQIHPHKSVTHTFRLPSQGVGVLSLLVSIVFQGHFKPVGYQNGRLAGMLYVLPPSPSSTDSNPVYRPPIPVGKCFYEHDIELCTPQAMGKLVLRHEPLTKPLTAAATYQVVLGAPVYTTYSMEITAKTAPFACEVLKQKRVDALKKQELLPLKKDEIQNVFVTIQLSERKKRLARKMASEAKDVAQSAELEMIRKTKELESDNISSILTHEQRLQLHTSIHDAEAKFTQNCFLFAKREEEVRDIEQCLKELTKIHADLLDECKRMENDLVQYRAHLPELAAALVEGNDVGRRDAAGAKVATELNVEYIPSGIKSSKVLWAELSAMKAKLPSMMTPAERLRRKYKKGQEILEKKEREWIIVDRILHPRIYEWEERLAVEGNYRMRLHGAYPKLTKDEEQLAVLSQMEIDRILKAPWNLLERKEIQIRKIFTKFRDDHGSSSGKTKQQAAPTTMVTLLRSQKTTQLTTEEREWRLYDQLLNPAYYPVNLKKLIDDLRSTVTIDERGGRQPEFVKEVSIPPNLTREDLVAALNTPEEDLYKLPNEILRARNLLLKYDPQLSTNLVEAARVLHGQSIQYDPVEIDVDARCRLVYQELQRAIANTRNEYMDSYVLHSTLQRFPTKVLRLELEKDLDRLLISQITEREEFELKTFLVGGTVAKMKVGLAHNQPHHVDSDSVSESDSDEEAQIARAAKAERKAKEDVKHHNKAKIRGKSLKQKSIEKQRREIKDALQGRSLEEKRLLLQEQELGIGGCMACRTNPCEWKPFLEESYVTIQNRMEVIQEELERVKRCPDFTIVSSVCMAAVKSGNKPITLKKSDLFDELTFELKIWDKNLRLKAVDEEFHNTFRIKDQYFETKALHGFTQIQLKDKIQIALQREHNLLIANLTAYEVVEDILESMLEGWVFGERESERKVLGYVPSLKREGPLTMHDLRRFEQEKRILDAREGLREEENIQGIPLEKWKPIEVKALEMDMKTKAVKKGSDLDKSLTETENALKFGLFSMTIMYFRGLALLKKQRSTWSISASKHIQREGLSKSAERIRMDEETKNAYLRQRKMALYDQKARNAQGRKQKFQEQKATAYRRRLVAENQKMKREAHAAREIQRVYRGHLGKIAGKKWMIRRREIDAQRALERAAAITLQRAYRGRLGRIEAEERRVELAEFISQIRAEEAIEEEEEYWRTHRIERVARKLAAFVKKEA